MSDYDYDRTYKCPCGKSTITEHNRVIEHDTMYTPDEDITMGVVIDCPECKKNYIVYEGLNHRWHKGEYGTEIYVCHKEKKHELNPVHDKILFDETE